MSGAVGTELGTVLVTGASGLLGSNVLHILPTRCKVVGLYNRHPITVPGVETIQVDLLDVKKVSSVFKNVTPDVLIHCAALTDVDYCERHPDIADAVNAQATRDLAILAKRSSCRFVYISTDAVYGGVEGNFSETDPVSPVNWYGRSKLSGEQAVLEVSPDSLVLRTCIYGWNVRNKFSFSEMIFLSLFCGKEISLFDDVCFSPILVNDLVEGIIDLLGIKGHGVYNIGSPEGISKLDFGRRIAEMRELDTASIKAINLRDKHLSAPRPRCPTMNSNRFRAAVGRELPGVDDGLKHFFSFLENGYVWDLKQGHGIASLNELRQVWWNENN